MPRKPITDKDAPPRPWRICESVGGKFHIYASGEQQPIALLKSRKHPTRRDRATQELICVAVNKLYELGFGFILEEGLKRANTEGK